MWRPLPDAGDTGRGPLPLRGDLDALLAHLGAPPVDVVRVLDERWADLVGTATAAHARLAGVDNGTLVVEVDAPGWATKVRFGTRDLLAAIGREVGLGVITAVEVQVRPPRRR